jgi:hypothetical protein
MSEDLDQSNTDERAAMRGLATCTEGMLPKGSGECVLTSDELLWFSSKDPLNIPFNLWNASVSIKLQDIESVTTFWFLPASPVRIKASTGLYGFDFERGSRFHPLFILRSRRENQKWRKAIDELRGCKS